MLIKLPARSNYLYTYLIPLQRIKAKNRKMVSDDIRMIEEVLDNNRENIPENDRITSLNALMRIHNNNSSNQGSANTTTGYESTIVVTMNEIGVGHFNFQNRLLPDYGNILSYQRDTVIPIYISEWMLKQVEQRKANGFYHADFNFDLVEADDERTDYNEIKTGVIPILQSKGFDITMYHENTNFKENNNWGEYRGGITVSWDGIHDRYNMVNRREIFPKTRDQYYYEFVNESDDEDYVESDDEGPGRNLCLRRVLPENRITHAKAHILEWVRRDNELGCSAIDMFFCFCNTECKLTYIEVKNELVPVLQSDGFDVYLYYTVDNQFDEAHFDNAFSVLWKHDHNAPIDRMLHKIQRFHKTTTEYHTFDN